MLPAVGVVMAAATVWVQVLLISFVIYLHGPYTLLVLLTVCTKSSYTLETPMQSVLSPHTCAFLLYNNSFS